MTYRSPFYFSVPALNNPDWLTAPQFYPPLPVEAIPLPPLQPNYFVHADQNGQLVLLMQGGLQQISLGNEVCVSRVRMKQLNFHLIFSFTIRVTCEHS